MRKLIRFTGILLLTALTLSLFSCEDKFLEIIQNEAAWDKIKIGDYCQGGIVYDKRNGQMKDEELSFSYLLIAAPNDQSTGIVWDNTPFIKVGANLDSGGLYQDEVEANAAQTNAIIEELGDGSYAAKICADLVLNGYDNWYLPIRGELSSMRHNLHIGGFGNFTTAEYWSSTEDDVDIAKAIYFNQSSYSNSIEAEKDENYHVRATRIYYYFRSE